MATTTGDYPTIESVTEGALRFFRQHLVKNGVPVSSAQAATQKGGDRWATVSEGKGLPRITLSRGEIVYENGKVTAKTGRGKFVARKPFAPESKALSTWKELTQPKKVAR